MPTYSDWFSHTRCSCCEHFRKSTVTCDKNTPKNPLACGHHNGHGKYHTLLKDLKPGMVVKLPKHTLMKEPKGVKAYNACGHSNLVVLEVAAGKRIFEADKNFMDWTSNIVNAHAIRVTKYWCPSCNTIIKAPDYGSDK